jgi:RNA polymerase sigma factor (sigma-70 family)
VSVGLEQTWSLALRLRPGSVRAQEARRDVAAFASVYERHHRALYRYCRSMLRDEEDARDALQSTMAKALAALRDEERDFELRPWLFRIAHNEAVSRLRQRRDVVSLDAAEPIGADSLPQVLEDRERMAVLRSDLRELPERQRAALVLRELCGLGHEEIAEVLGTTARVVKQTIFEARFSLHEFDEGRAMICDEIQRALSDGDGRVLRGRRMRAHVRSCRTCRRFKVALDKRPDDLAALAPALPAGAAGAVLAQLLAGLEGGGSMTGLGGAASAALTTKAAMVAAAVVTAGATTLVHSAHDGTRPVTREPSVSVSRPPTSVVSARSAPRAGAAAEPRAVAVRVPAPRARAHRAVRHGPPPRRVSPRPLPAKTAAVPVQSARPVASGSAPAEHAVEPVPPGLAKKSARAPGQPPGLAKKSGGEAGEPPGLANKTQAPGTPPGLARKDATPAAPAADAQASLPPGQAKQAAKGSDE